MSGSSRLAIVVGILVTVVGPARAASPSTSLDDYALFAATALRAKELRIRGGDLGVNDGLLDVRGGLDASGSALVASTVHLPQGATCATLFTANAPLGGTACGTVETLSPPVVPDVAAACGLEVVPTSVAGAPAVTVPGGTTLALDAGEYGDVVVARSAGAGGTLVLTGGDYVFGSVRVTRLGRIEAAAPARVLIAGDVRVATSAMVGPSPGSGADDLVVHSAGARATFGRRTSVVARLCAPLASLQVEDDARLVGSFVARDILARRITVTGVAGGATTTSTSTTSTTASQPPTTSSTSTTAVPSSTTSTTTSSRPSTSSSSSTTSSPPSTSSSSSTTSSTGPPTTSPPTTTTSTQATTTSSQASTTTIGTSTSSSSSTTSTPPTTSSTTTLGTLSCPASRLVDVTATLEPASDGSTHSPAGGLKVRLAYPATVTLPGSGSLPVNDPTDATTREALLDLNLYNGFVFFFDSDAAFDASVAGIPIPLGSPYGFERVRFDCAEGTAIDPSAFACTVVDESDTLGGVVPASLRPGCVFTVTAVP